jgi:hypothetical protein
MPQDNLNYEQIEEFRRRIDDEAMETIDFDAVGLALGEIVQSGRAERRVTAELTRLKEEYRDRILGMLRANLACRRDAEEAELACRLSGEGALENITAEEWIKLYGQTVRRFRDNFPASFRYLTFPGKKTGRRDWSEHKI